MKDSFLDELDHELSGRLGVLRDVPARDPAASERGRAAYLELARGLSAGKSPAIPVSESSARRHKGWTWLSFNSLRRKERFPMMATLTTVVLTLALLFGGAGATVYAAQDSLPSEVLYPVKTMSEDARLQLAWGEGTQFEWALALAQRRVEEIVALQAQGDPVGEPVMTRLQEHLNLALQLAAGMSDEGMAQALLKMRALIQEQLQTMTMAMAKTPDTVDPALERVQAMLQAQQRLAETGLVDPLRFRNQFQYVSGQGEPGGSDSLGPGPQEQPPGEGDGPGPGPQEQPPAEGYGPGPGPQEEPPGGDYGSGPGPQEQPPGEGDGSGPGPQEEPPGGSYGPGPGPQQEPPGSGYGPGPQGEPSGSGVSNGAGAGDSSLQSPATTPPDGGGTGGKGSGGK